MSHATPRLLAAMTLTAAALSSLALAAGAQTSAFYSPPKVIKQGASALPTSTGTVRLKVQVKKNGAVGTVAVMSSTNHADDAAAIEIAKTSQYKPGARDAKPEDAYYTYVLRFGGGTVSSATGAQAGTSTAGVTSGSGPKAAAAKTYADAAATALKAGNPAQALVSAQQSIAAMPTANGYYLQGVADLDTQRFADAATSLDQAKSLAEAGHAPAASLNAIDAERARADILSGQRDKGLALAQDLKQRDPGNVRADDAIATYYEMTARDEAQARPQQAVAAFEAGAKAVPARAVVLYLDAANVLAHQAKSSDDWKQVKAEADKALAVDPNSAAGNYLAGVALGNAGDLAGAKTALEKAKANAGSDSSLAAQIDAQLAALAKLGPKQ